MKKNNKIKYNKDNKKQKGGEKMRQIIETIIKNDVATKDKDKAKAIAESITQEMIDSLEAKVYGWDSEGGGYYIQVEDAIVSANYEMSVEEAKIVYLLGREGISFDMTYCADDELPDEFKEV